MLGEDHNL